MFCSVHWELLKQSSPATNTDRYKHRGFNDKKIPTSSPYFYDKEDSRKHLWMTLFFIEQIHNLCSLPKHYMHMQLYSILKSQIYKLGKKTMHVFTCLCLLLLIYWNIRTQQHCKQMDRRNHLCSRKFFVFINLY